MQANSSKHLCKYPGKSEKRLQFKSATYAILPYQNFSEGTLVGRMEHDSCSFVMPMSVWGEVAVYLLGFFNIIISSD